MTAIVITACHRPDALRRLIGSLERCRGIEDVALIVSVDAHPDAAASIDVARDAHVPVHVMVQPQRLGLREHFFHSGDLVAEHGTVILLEDDLYASVDLLDYVRAALEQYAGDRNIAALSLSAFAFHEPAEAPFAPIDDGNDAWFAQSGGWGMVFTREQWAAFRAFDVGRVLRPADLLPDAMNRWPEPTWKRLFNLYLAVERKYVVVPRHGLTANLAEPGVHVSRAVTYLTTPLSRGRHSWRFPPLSGSHCRYDAFLQLEAESLRSLSRVPLPESLALDLYCQRDPSAYGAEWIITSRCSSSAERSFGLRLFPFEENVIEGIAGHDADHDLVLARRDNVLPEPRTRTLERMRSFFIPPWR